MYLANTYIFISNTNICIGSMYIYYSISYIYIYISITYMYFVNTYFSIVSTYISIRIIYICTYIHYWISYTIPILWIGALRFFQEKCVGGLQLLLILTQMQIIMFITLSLAAFQQDSKPYKKAAHLPEVSSLHPLKSSTEVFQGEKTLKFFASLRVNETTTRSVAHDSYSGKL